MARTDSLWETGNGGTYIYTIDPVGYDVLINGTSKYLNFNTTVGSSGYGFRDNAGTMQVKNSGGSWANFGSGGSGGQVNTVVGTTNRITVDATDPVNPIVNISATFEALLVKLDQTSGQTIGATGARLTKLWATDITVTNAIIGSVTGNAGTVTTNANLTGVVTSIGNTTSIANSAISNAMLANGAVANLSGTNTGDQTITLTGAVIGSGTGSFATTFATPGTLNQSSSNSNATAHTHAITTATAPTASTITAFDANKNLSANNLIESFTTTATAAGTTTMAVGDTYQQVWTGSSTQTVKLPTTSVAQGQQWNISNQSSGNVTVQSSGANTIVILGAGMSATFTAQVATPTTAANWGCVLSEYIGLNNAVTASGNAATINLAYKTNTVTNNSAATISVTIPTAGAIDGETRILRVLDFSAAAQTLTLINTENGVTPPAVTNGSTTLPLTLSLQYNAGTSKWRVVGYA